MGHFFVEMRRQEAYNRDRVSPAEAAEKTCKGDRLGKLEQKNDFDEMLRAVIAQARALKIPVSARIEQGVVVNRRAKRRFGCCKRLAGGTDSPYVIELSAALVDAPRRAVMQTLAHEILHTCRGCGNHGARGNEYAARKNAAYGYEIKRTSSPAELGIFGAADMERRLPARYLLVCRRCGARIERSRMSRLVQYPQSYRCRCGGELKREK